MNMRLMFALLAGLALASPAMVLADAGQKTVAQTTVDLPSLRPLQACPTSLEQKLNVAQTTQGECCKAHKGVCGCRAGKIICCDGSASTVAGCTCHGDDGFPE